MDSTNGVTSTERLSGNLKHYFFVSADVPHEEDCLCSGVCWGSPKFGGPRGISPGHELGWRIGGRISVLLGLELAKHAGAEGWLDRANGSSASELPGLLVQPFYRRDYLRAASRL